MVKDKVALTTMLGNYPNTEALKSVKLHSDLIDFDFADVKVANNFFKQIVRDAKFDVGELAIATYLQAKSYDKPYVLLPAVLVSRGQHHTIAYNPEKGDLKPSDLTGKRVGLRAYTVTTATWVRGILAEEYGVRVSVLPKDLSDPSTPPQIGRDLAARGIAVDVLVNNAGFGVYGLFAETSIDRELEMIQVNVVALTHLTKLILAGMLARRLGRILNVASTAAFQPGPLMAVYYATKAYVLSFSEALANETAGTGVTVTTLCPGPTPTGFAERAGFGTSPLLPGPFVWSASAVARAGWSGMMRGKRVVVPGLANRAIVQAERFTPRRLVTAVARKLQESRARREAGTPRNR